MMEQYQQHKAERCGSAPTRQFSTRFLPSDGIPEYNALLDSHLGKRREFLLGNRHSLELMQQTGVIERVEAQPDNPNQYVVHIAEKPIHRRKRLPPRSSSGPLQLPESQLTPWRQHSAPRGLLATYSSSDQGSNSLRRGSASTPQLPATESPERSTDTNSISRAAVNANVATLKGLGRSYSTNAMLKQCKPVMKSSAANRLALFGSTKCSALLESAGFAGNTPPEKSGEASVRLSRVAEMRQRSRSAIPAVLTPAVEDFKAKHVVAKKSVPAVAAPQPAPQPVKGTVEHLLESDASFMAQIRVMRDQLAGLEAEKARLDAEVGLLRRKLRGVNAVRENDVAVAHCSSIMQHRLSKAEEEFMKLVTQQQEVKKDVDRVRRELLSLRKVRHKLLTDIEDVAQANQVFEEKIHASKVVRNQLSEELSELERRAEVELEEQRLNLPPEDAVVVDVAKLMSAVQERNVARRNASFTGYDGAERLSESHLHPSVAQTSPGKSSGQSPRRKSIRRGSGSQQAASLLDYCTAFRVLQNSLSLKDLDTFEQQFTAAEEQLLSKYKANLALADELAALEKELLAVNVEKKTNRANVRGIMQANEKVERDMQVRIQTALGNVRFYNELREQRNREHLRLRGIMIRCLDALNVDATSSELAGDSGRGGSSSSNASASSHALFLSDIQSPELLEMLQRKMTQVAVTMKVKHSSHMFDVPAEALRLSRGHDGRRSNMFSMREASKIVLGPREPPGSALAAIVGTVQVPSVEAAMALTENVGMMEVMHGLHRATSPERRRASALAPLPPVIGKTGARNSTIDVSPGVLLHDGGPSVSSPSVLSPARGLANTCPSLAAMPETDKEDEDSDTEQNEDEDTDEVAHTENDEDVDLLSS